MAVSNPAPVAVALDAPDLETAARWAALVTPHVSTVKVGLELYLRYGPQVVATVRGAKASLFVVDHGVAHQQTVAVKGEAGGSLFLDPALPAGAAGVVEGRALLEDGDSVTVKEMPAGGDEPARAAPALVTDAGLIAQDPRPSPAVSSRRGIRPRLSESAAARDPR